jgi:hypothetical protein
MVRTALRIGLYYACKSEILWHNTDNQGYIDKVYNITFDDIESDDMGRDVVTFVCPHCKDTHQSLVMSQRA